jgi:hypothetical protein
MSLLENLWYDSGSGKFYWIKATRNRHAGALAGWVDERDGYVRIQIDKKSYLAHRLAWLAVYGALPTGLLDHKNGDRADNRIDNLRLATRAQNTQNSKTYSNSPVGLKGVRLSGNRWVARITVSKVLLHLGSFGTKEAAHAAYCAAAHKYFGEFSNSGGAACPSQ